jgi:hypothetical protein
MAACIVAFIDDLPVYEPGRATERSRSATTSREESFGISGNCAGNSENEIFRLFFEIAAPSLILLPSRMGLEPGFWLRN